MYKMKKASTQKGITLVALIITIIVLLILTVVAIRAVQGDGIIQHAKNSTSEYKKGQKNENSVLSEYELLLAEETGNAWKQEKTKVIKGDITLVVGQTVTNYTSGGYTWKVLGAENGNLLLTTSVNINNSFEIKGPTATAGWNTKEYRFVTAEEELNTECKNKITDLGAATLVRSIKVEDINRVTGYYPTRQGDGTVYGAGSTNEYGNKVTYTAENTTDSYGFRHPDGRTLGENNITSIEVESNYYNYYPYSLTTINSTTGECKGISTDSPAYIMLFGNDMSYWLASSCVNTFESYAWFNLRIVSGGNVNSWTVYTSNAGGSSFINSYGVRPVVSLGHDFQPAV